MSADTVELGMNKFISAIEQCKALTKEENIFSMEKAQSICINDTENDGCKIIRRESSGTKTTVVLDFEQTTSKLCSLIYRTERSDWSDLKNSKAMLCFDIYVEGKISQTEIELKFADHNEQVSILLTDDKQSFCIPLSQFVALKKDWEQVRELCFLFRKKHVMSNVKVVVENLRLE